MSEGERNQVDFEASSKWKELIEAVKDACSKLGGFKLYIDENSPNEFIAKRVHDGIAVKRLRLEFDPLVPKVSWQCCNPNETRGEISFRAFNGSVVYVVGAQVKILNEIVFVLTRCLTGEIA